MFVFETFDAALPYPARGRVSDGALAFIERGLGLCNKRFEDKSPLPCLSVPGAIKFLSE